MAMRLATGPRLATRFSNEPEPLPSFPRRWAGDDFLRFRIEEFDLAPRRAQRLVHHARAQEIDACGYSLGLLQDEAIEIAAADEIQKAKFGVLHD
jgi:hypothetical protein